VIDGRYRVETVPGEGGTGVVYRCSHTIIGKKLALKVLRADLARDREVTERFLNEAKSASESAAAHRHISDSAVPRRRDLLVMEYLNGVRSAPISGGQPLPIPRLKIGRQLAEGRGGHAAGIVIAISSPTTSS
jgi:serine/threonine-protein kinase